MSMLWGLRRYWVSKIFHYKDTYPLKDIILPQLLAAGMIALIDCRESDSLITYVLGATLWGFFVHFSCEAIHDGRIQYFKGDQHVYASQTMYISPLVTIGINFFGVIG